MTQSRNYIYDGIVTVNDSAANGTATEYKLGNLIVKGGLCIGVQNPEQPAYYADVKEDGSIVVNLVEQKVTSDGLRTLTHVCADLGKEWTHSDVVELK